MPRLTAWFLAVCFSIMLLTWGVLAISGLHNLDRWVGFLFVLGAASPSAAGLIVTGLTSGRPALAELIASLIRLRIGWTAVAMIVGLPALAAAAMLAMSPPAARSGWSAVALLGPLAAPIIEELGWRGTMLRDLLTRTTAARASVLVGIAWSLWHLPLFLIPGTAQSTWNGWLVEFGIFAVGTMALSVLFTVAYIRSGRSLFSAIGFHGAVNLAGLAAQHFADVGLTGRVAETMVYSVAAAIVLGSKWLGGDR